MSEFAFPAGRPHSDGTVTFGSDERLWVEFHKKSILNRYESEIAGRPVFVARDFVKIMQPGERDCVDREVIDMDRMRFPKQWAAYQNKQEQTPPGTPLAILLPAEPEVVDTLRAQRVYTIEQLRDLTDTGMQNIGMGARELQNRARAFLEAADKHRGATELQRVNDDLSNQIGVLKEQIAQLMAAGDQEDAPRRRGRPPGSRSTAPDQQE